MRVFRHYEEVPDDARHAVVAIGNFDGIHRGHQAIIGRAHEIAREIGAPVAVLTFEPHPRTFFQPDSPAFRLTPFRLKARLIQTLDVDSLFVLTFDQALSQLTAETFVQDVLCRGLQARHVVVGDNFAFGHKRQGNVVRLQQWGDAHGFGVTCLTRVEHTGGEAYSSTQVRKYLLAGNPTRAALLLGRYWEIEGRVQQGDQRGRRLGFPTANIALGDILEPARGVYAVRAGIEQSIETSWHAGVANLGVRPTVDGETLLLEVHLFDFEQDIYGQHMRVALVDHLRPEMRFDGLEALKAQIAEDGERARVILTWENWEAGWPSSPFSPDRRRAGRLIGGR